MFARRLITGGLLLAVPLAAACSAPGEVTVAPSSKAEPTVTQSAPSVWSPATSEPAPSGDAGSSDGAPTASVMTLAGLTEECSNAVQAQTAVSSLLSDAIAQAPIPPTDEDAPDNSTVSAMRAGTGEPLTESKVQEVFSTLAPLRLPSDVTAAVKTMRAAAIETVGMTAVQIAQILSSDPAAAAMSTITDYVKACHPEPTE